MNITFGTSVGDLNIEQPSFNEDEWIVVRSASETTDKSKFFVTAFDKDFPSIVLAGKDSGEKYAYLCDLCSRSRNLKRWLAATQLSYSNTAQLPLYLKDSVEPADYRIVQDNILVLKSELKVISAERKRISEKYSSDLDALDMREADIVKKVVGDDNIMKILLLTSDCLPLSLQIKIKEYKPTSEDAKTARNRRALSQEYLAKFKAELLRINAEVPNFDVDALVEELSLK